MVSNGKNPRHGLRGLSALTLVAGVACIAATPAHAIVNPAVLSAVNAGMLDCSVSPASAPLLGEIAPAQTASKAAAILGGQPSALEMIRRQQADVAAVASPPVIVAAAPKADPVCRIAAFPAVPSFVAVPDPVARPSARPDTFLGSARVGIRQTPFTAAWQRVSANRLSAPAVASLLGEAPGVRTEALALVNQWTNRHIEYADDRTLYGARDRWATAAETLSAGRGDCEDYAILKYQMLAALGFDRSDMYLTLARDLIRNADHAVLVVRLGDRHYMLDNASDAVLPANVSHDYRAVMSFSSESAWLHGATTRAPATPRFAYLSERAVSSARVTGLNR